MENKFCFVAIVKNESHVMKRCIDSIANIASSYLICDTGSDDGTPELIEKIMQEKEIPGQVIHKEWQDYAYNRSYVMEQVLTNKITKNAKYIIWHDADEVFIKDPNNSESYPTQQDADKLFDWLEKIDEPMIQIETFYGHMRYKRCHIVRNNQLYVWKSPKHEWIHATQDNRVRIYDQFILLARQQGGASKDPLRCQKDVKLFLNYMDKNGGFENCPREVFYLAQEYESFDKQSAIQWYLKKIQIKADWIQEKYITYLRLGRLCENEEDKIKYWSEGFKLIPRRLECIYEIVKHYMAKKDFKNAFCWGIQASENRNYDPHDLFVESDAYNHLLDLDISNAAYYSGYYQLSNEINQKNLFRNKNKPICALLESNQKFIDQRIKEQSLIKLTYNQ